MRLRTRFAAGGAAAIGLLAALVVPGLSADARADAFHQVDLRLQAVARVATPALAVAADPPVTPRTPGDTGVNLVGADGTSTRLGLLPDELPPPDVAGLATVDGDGRSWRVLTETVDARLRRADRAPVVVQYAIPLDAAERLAAAATRGIVIGTGLIAALAAGLSWLIGGYAARPLRRLRDATGTLTGQARVPADQHVEEVDDLARTVNALLDRVDEQQGRTAAALEASRSFAANAAHELRTPLTSLSANVQVLSAYPGLPEEERSTIHAELAVQLERMQSLLDALRELARADAHGTEVRGQLDLCELSDEVVDSFRRRHRDVPIQLEVSSDLQVHGWADGLRLMISNLLDNARVHGRPPIHVRLEEDAGSVRIVVDDAGPGVPPAARTRIFQRFSRATTSADGTGLGLALVAQQAHLHGGDVSVTDAPGGGARFVVRLPRPAGP
jgi:two-component system, OmpR family, sensor histidine kinase PrrB